MPLSRRWRARCRRQQPQTQRCIDGHPALLGRDAQALHAPDWATRVQACPSPYPILKAALQPKSRRLAWPNARGAEGLQLQGQQTQAMLNHQKLHLGPDGSLRAWGWPACHGRRWARWHGQGCGGHWRLVGLCWLKVLLEFLLQVVHLGFAFPKRLQVLELPAAHPQQTCGESSQGKRPSACQPAPPVAPQRWPTQSPRGYPSRPRP